MLVDHFGLSDLEHLLIKEFRLSLIIIDVAVGVEVGGDCHFDTADRCRGTRVERGRRINQKISPWIKRGVMKLRVI